MDFNPLDILAAAALGQKDAPSDVKSEVPLTSAQTFDKCEENNDAEDDVNEDMGKTTSNSLIKKSVEKADKNMAPQKSPWSPDAFLSPNLGVHDIVPDTFSIGDIMQDLKKGVECQKLENSLIINDKCGPLSKVQCNNINNNVISVNNVTNLTLDLLSKSLPPKSLVIENPLSVKSVDDDCSSRDPEVQTDNSDQGSPSDTDTADSDSKLSESNDVTPIELVGLDHTYALIPGQLAPAVMMDPFDEDDDVDVCSQNSPLTEDTEQRSRNLSLDCNYLKTGILQATSASAYDLYKMSSCALGRSKIPSSSSSTSSPTRDMMYTKSGTLTGDLSSQGLENSASLDQRSPNKLGKFRIGTYASFSSSNLELEKYLRNKDNVNGKRLNIGIPPETSLVASSLGSPTTHPTLHPFLQSPSVDWDRSEVGSDVLDDSSDARTPHRLSPDFTTERAPEWSHPMYHDHDYCSKNSNSKSSLLEELTKPSTLKRKYTKRKSKFDSIVNHEKIMKAKYLKEELLKQDKFKQTASSSREVDFMPIDSQSYKANPVGRPKKRPFEKVEEEEIDPETGAKMKITGKYQDDYVYYLSKSSRTTKRRQTPSLPFPTDKIIVPAPKPGDIIVPHLTDADIEAVRLRGRAALDLPERPHIKCSINKTTPPVVAVTPSNESINDADSHIVSTILSMESDIGSPSSSLPSDISNSQDLNPNQPALTESLRLMSGDNNIKSEDMLNYLLSIVKDNPEENLLSNGTGFDSSTSSAELFAPLPSDSTYSKVDNLEPGSVNHSELTTGNHSSLCNDELQKGTTSLQVSTISSSTIHSSDKQHQTHFAPSISKAQDDENIHLNDDLSSFISNSQETVSSCTTHDGDSQSSLKSMFGSDLSSIDTPQISSSVPRLTSIEKTLDYLGVKGDEITLDENSDGLSSKFHMENNSLDYTSNVSDDDTPWIVTVTLYCNDVPAIMVNNEPYIRLVDIHKQILPAKDTGILKKRCQLLKITVLNCSEMQRYFLVQYGRAYNSKSSLIVSKDKATDLVSYYASPQPRLAKGDQAQSFRSRSSDSGGTMSPVTVIGSGASRKKNNVKGCRKTASSNGYMLPEANDAHVTELADPTFGDGVHGKRTRHKKVNYLGMLRGEEKEKSHQDSVMETIEAVVRSAPGYCDQNSKKKNRSNDSSSSNKKVKTNDHCDRKIKKSKTGKISKLDRKKQSGEIETVKGSKVKKSKSDKLKFSKNCDPVLSELDSDDSDSESASKPGPLKLKVNSLLNFAGNKKGSSPTKKCGLFSRSNSSSSSSERPLRVLAVAHQAAFLNNNEESHLPSQPADIHLDLFTRSSSPCVRCQTCCQFLSVPDFMRHHHVAMDNEWLATEAVQRILVPRNKENISEQEKRLWEEFHRLQEAIGGFGEGDDETETDENDDFEDEADGGSINMSGTSSSLLGIDRSYSSHPVRLFPISHDLNNGSSDTDDNDEDVEDGNEANNYVRKVTPPKLSLDFRDECAKKRKHEKAQKIGLMKRDPCEAKGSSISHSLNGINSSHGLSNLRTSSRKRKSKQLFSIENYDTPKRVVNTDDLQNNKSLSVTDGVISSRLFSEPLDI